MEPIRLSYLDVLRCVASTWHKGSVDMEPVGERRWSLTIRNREGQTIHQFSADAANAINWNNAMHRALSKLVPTWDGKIEMEDA